MYLRFAGLGDFGGNAVLPVHNVCEDLIGCATGKWRPPSDHHIQDDTETPHIWEGRGTGREGVKEGERGKEREKERERENEGGREGGGRERE